MCSCWGRVLLFSLSSTGKWRAKTLLILKYMVFVCHKNRIQTMALTLKTTTTYSRLLSIWWKNDFISPIHCFFSVFFIFSIFFPQQIPHFQHEYWFYTINLINMFNLKSRARDIMLNHTHHIWYQDAHIDNGHAFEISNRDNMDGFCFYPFQICLWFTSQVIWCCCVSFVVFTWYFHFFPLFYLFLT